MCVRSSRLSRRAFSIARLHALEGRSGFFMRSEFFQILIVPVGYLRSYSLGANCFQPGVFELFL
eukprot:8287273-Pyramimonas_sp.AAC.1